MVSFIINEIRNLMEIVVFGGGVWGRVLVFVFGEKNEVKIILRWDLNELLKKFNDVLIFKGFVFIE